MIQWNDIGIKYSLLLSGMKLDVCLIERCLKDGIKVLWFGNEKDCETLNQKFFKYIQHLFLCVYEGCEDIHLVIIDGIGIQENYLLLEKLETADSRFNLKQYEIEHDGDARLVVVQAGAGSGKTYVMNNRLLYLLHTKEDFDFKDVVMVTFTNEATDSMRQKLIELLNCKLIITGNIRYLKWIEEVSQISISTIHSFLKQVIVEIGPLLGYGTNLKLSSMAMEKRTILRDILDYRYQNNEDTVQNVLGLPIYEIEKLAMQFWKKIENNGLSEYDVFSMEWGTTETPEENALQDSLKQIFEEVEEKYNIRKLESNAIAMSDIIHEFNRVVNDSRIKDYITHKYKYLFCDEFQDSDDVQIQTIAVLAKIYNGNLFVVGDIKQSIYRFRGATDSAFERLNANIKKEFGRDCIREPYSLAKNYRSSEAILNEIDQIFRGWGDKGYLRYEYGKKNNDVLIPQVKKEGIYKQIIIYRLAEIEKKFNDLVSILYEKDGNQRKTIVVLTRYNWQLQRIKEWCEKVGRACSIRERGSFFKSPAVREFCAMVEAFLYHSEPMYLYNFVRTSYCFKPVDTEYLRAISGSKYKLLVYFTNLIKEIYSWEEELESFRKRPVMSILSELISKRKPSIIYGAIQREKYKTMGYNEEEGNKQAILDAKQYEADLQKLMQILETTFLDEFSSLADICKYLRLKINTDIEEESAEITGLDKMKCIQGLTVHSAKGLEFDYVLIPFMNDMFGKNNKSDILIDKELKLVGWQYIKDKNSQGMHNALYKDLCKKEKKEIIGDETRLLYVAMTRPIEGLFCFTWWKRNSGDAQTWSDLLPEEKDDANYL